MNNNPEPYTDNDRIIDKLRQINETTQETAKDLREFRRLVVLMVLVYVFGPLLKKWLSGS
jgi:hypothetical protein